MFPKHGERRSPPGDDREDGNPVFPANFLRTPAAIQGITVRRLSAVEGSKTETGEEGEQST